MNNRANYSKKSTYRLIDLFAGAGGLTLGFSEKFGHPFKSVWANDYNREAVDTYNLNFGSHCVHGDIVSIIEQGKIKIPKADVVIGGPPCQGFSLLNKNRLVDPRKEMWRPFLDVVKLSGAEVFVMENVPQLLGSLQHESIRITAEDMGFRITDAKLLAADYGVPQVRYRAFIVGCRFMDPSQFFPPLKTHYNPKNGFRPGAKGYVLDASEWRTVRHAISDLDFPSGTEILRIEPPYNLHFGRTPTPTSKKRYRAIPREGMNRFDLQRLAPSITPKCWIRKKSGGTDLFGRLWWDRPAFTIRTEFFKPEKGRYLHPTQHRPITHREAARFQSFPDEFKFVGSKIEVAKQIGNAVPPLLGSAVATCIERLLKKRNARPQR